MIGIMADSHDNLPNIRKAVSFFNNANVDMVIHAGDLISPFTVNEFNKLEMPFEAVFGNNDGERNGLKTAYSDLCSLEDFKEFNLFKRKIAVIHGHQEKITEILSSCGLYDVLIRGHSHQSNISYKYHSLNRVDIHLDDLDLSENEILDRNSRTLIINPGETCGYLSDKSTVVLLDPQDLNWNLIEL